MLSRTADHLYWMSRYTERAENTARMLDVNYQTSLLPQSAEVAKYGWQGLLSISELLPTSLAQLPHDCVARPAFSDRFRITAPNGSNDAWRLSPE